MVTTKKRSLPSTILLVIILAAVVLRIGIALYLGNTIEETRGGTSDQISYDALAQRVVGGHGFSFAEDHWPYAKADTPTAFWSYLYTLYLAGVYVVLGHQPLAARLIQAIVVGILTPWLIFRIAEKVFDTRTAVVAAALAAVYAYFILYGASLMTEALYIVGVLWCLLVAMRVAEGPVDVSRKRWVIWQGVEFGVAISVTLLLRQTIVLFLFVLMLWLLWVAWRRARIIETLQILAVSGTIVMLFILPFVYRNYQVFGRVSLPNTNAGFAFFWSNHPIYGTRFESVLSPAHGVSYQELIPQELRSLNEAELDRALMKRGLEFVREEPMRYALLSLSRVPVYFLFWPTATSSALSNLARISSFGLMLPFMIGGLMLTLRGLPGRCKQPGDDFSCEEIILLLIFVGSYTAIHLASWANVRYRLPIDAVLIIFAAYAIGQVYERWLAPTMVRRKVGVNWQSPEDI